MKTGNMTFDDMTDDQRRAIVNAAIALGNAHLGCKLDPFMAESSTVWVSAIKSFYETIEKITEAHDGEKD